jgi:hypothetical protein
MNDINTIKEKIRNVDFNFIRYIQEETKSYGNKVILFSSLIILLCLNIVKIKELELEGIKINVKPYLVIIILVIISIYYFLQFLNSAKIDNLVSKMPNEITEIFRLIDNAREIRKQKLDNLTEEYKIALEKNQVDEVTQNKLESKRKEIEEEDYLEISDRWISLSTTFLKHHQRNMQLNIYFPKIYFAIAIISFLLRMYWA